MKARNTFAPTHIARRTDGSTSNSQQSNEVKIMRTINSIARDGRSIIGFGFLGVLAAIATLQLAVLTPPSLPVASVPAATTNFSSIPQGFSDYQNLRTVAPRSSFSPLPQGLTDYQAPALAAPRSSLSPLPNGLTDYQSLQPRARVVFSEMPRGLSDYLALAPKAKVNHSALPTGLTDYTPLNTIASVQPNFSALPRGYTDYLSPAR